MGYPDRPVLEKLFQFETRLPVELFVGAYLLLFISGAFSAE
jgi:hypothetical protein